MKIRKVDDKPMVIHTKEKAKIYAHEPKGAKIKGSNIYTVERGPKVLVESVLIERVPFINRRLIQLFYIQIYYCLRKGGKHYDEIL